MRPFEILTLLLLTWSLTSLFIYRDRKSFLYLLFASIIGILIQYLVGGLRWQFLPTVYLLPAIFLIYKFKNTNFAPKFLLGIWLVISIILPWSIPVFDLPEPKGEFLIGTQSFHWVDNARLEWFTDEVENDTREIMVQIWYPAENAIGLKKNKYMDFMDLRSNTLAAAGKIPSFLPRHLDMVNTNSYQNAECSNKKNKYPALIFSHGLSGSRHLHQVLFEHLASFGYIIIAPDHSFDSNLSIFPNGNVANYRSEITGKKDSVLIRSKQIKTRYLDIEFVLNQIEKINDGKIFSNISDRIDMENIAIGGHSYGGATAILTSHNDSRIKVCFVLDSWINPLPDSVIFNGINIPFLSLGRPNWNDSDYPTNYLELEKLLKKSSNKKYDLRIKNTLHLDYTDIPLMSPLIEYVMEVGSLSPTITLPLINDVIYHFLEENLLKKESTTLDSILDNKLINKL